MGKPVRTGVLARTRPGAAVWSLSTRTGGALLAELLLGGPVAGLGDDVSPLRIGFQQSAYSPVDDLMVAGDQGS